MSNPTEEAERLKDAFMRVVEYDGSSLDGIYIALLALTGGYLEQMHQLSQLPRLELINQTATALWKTIDAENYNSAVEAAEAAAESEEDEQEGQDYDDEYHDPTFH